MTKFETIREFARRGIVSEHYLRLLCKRRLLPGIYVGTRFLINVDIFLEQLERESREAVTDAQ